MTSRQKRILEAIQAVETERGEVTPRALWESARDPDHPLHGEFQWDDSEAAKAYRDDQARRLLRLRVTVTYEERIISAPICVRRPEAPAGEQNYIRTTRVLDDREVAKRVLLEEIERASRAVERARLVAEALGFSEECDGLIRQLANLRERAA